MNKVYEKTSGAGNVCILMCTYQGEKHLTEQLESIRKQTYRHWRLFVSDDGSTDNTMSILRDFRSSLASGQMEIFCGPKKGFANNFMSLLLNPSIKGSYYAFSDQDDFWCDDKLSAAILNLTSLPENEKKPAAYASARTMVDEALKPIGSKKNRRLIPSFYNALVQNIAGGNTIVINGQMRQLLLEIGAVEIVSHDWWVYLVCTGAGGIFYYDEVPHLLYRQHLNNAIGSKHSLRARLNTVRQVVDGQYRRWTDINVNSLTKAKWAFTNKNIIALEALSTIRNKRAYKRVFSMVRSEIHRQTRLGTAGLLLACLLNMI